MFEPVKKAGNGFARLLSYVFFGALAVMIVVNVAGGSAAAGVSSLGSLWGILSFAVIAIGGLLFMGKRTVDANQARIEEVKQRGSSVIVLIACVIVAPLVLSMILCSPGGNATGNSIVCAISSIAQSAFPLPNDQ